MTKDNAVAGSPAWSADGKRLAFYSATLEELNNIVTVRRLRGTTQIETIDLESGKRETLTSLFTHPEKSAVAPAWSPDGGRIAFSFGRFFQTAQNAWTADVAVIGIDGSNLQILTDGKANYGFPGWSRDGREIVYREATKGRNALHILDVQTGKSRELVSGAAHYNFPAYSSTDDVIAFTSDVDGDYEIYTIRPDGTKLTRLTQVAGNDAHSSWSPDGQWLAFASSRMGFKDEAALHPANPQPYGDIYVMRADGSDARALTDDQFEEATPGWMRGN